jgi:hypothetical protein
VGELAVRVQLLGKALKQEIVTGRKGKFAIRNF